MCLVELKFHDSRFSYVLLFPRWYWISVLLNLFVSCVRLVRPLEGLPLSVVRLRSDRFRRTMGKQDSERTGPKPLQCVV